MIPLFQLYVPHLNYFDDSNIIIFGTKIWFLTSISVTKISTSFSRLQNKK